MSKAKDVKSKNLEQQGDIPVCLLRLTTIELFAHVKNYVIDAAPAS
jgi:hypothetical protein